MIANVVPDTYLSGPLSIRPLVKASAAPVVPAIGPAVDRNRSGGI